MVALLPESKERGYKSGRFSFNVKGVDVKHVERWIKNNHFLSDVYVKCEECEGRRFNKET